MAEEFKGFSNESLRNVQGVRDTMREVDLAVRDLNKQLTATDRTAADINSEFSGINNSAKKFADLQDQASRSSKATTDSIKEQQKQLNIVRSLNVRIDDLYRSASKVTGIAAFNLKKQAENLANARDNAKTLANEYNKLAEDSAKLDKSTQFFSSISEFVSDIRGLRAFSKPFQDAAEAARMQVLENAKAVNLKERIGQLTNTELTTGKGLTADKIKQLGLEDIVGKKRGTAAAQALRAAKDTAKTQSVGLTGLQAGFKSLGSIITKALGPLALIKLVAEFIEASFAADKRVTDIAKNLSIGKDAARGIYDNLTDLKGTLDTEFATTENLAKAFNEIATLTEFSAIATSKQLETQIVLTNQLGQSVDEALALQGIFAVNNIEADKGLDIVYDQIAAFANQNKIVADGRQILKQIQGVSKQILLNFKGNTPELVKTILQANKLGLSLDQVDKIAGSLLDFEQSISAELNAELLTGQQLNLEKARLFALNNDIAGLTQEIANQGITAEKFAGMNRIQQQAIAQSLGLQASELGDALYKSKLIDQVAGDTTKKLREQAKLQEQKGNYEEANRLNAQAAAIEQGIVEGKTLEQAQKSVDTQAKFNLALERAKEIFTDVIDGGLLDGLVSALEGIVRNLEALGFTSGVKSLDQQSTQAAKIQGQKGNTLSAAQITELQDLANREMGLFGFTNDLLPVSNKRVEEARKTLAQSESGKTINADDFTIRTHPKDEIVVAGGTNLSGGSNQEMVSLLKELISATKQGQNVTVAVDGTNVFKAMNTSKYMS
jgi:hypothetical protein